MMLLGLAQPIFAFTQNDPRTRSGASPPFQHTLHFELGDNSLGAPLRAAKFFRERRYVALRRQLDDVSQASILDEPCIRGDASHGKRAHRSREHRIRSALAELAHHLAKEGVGQPYVHHRNRTYNQVVDQPSLLEDVER